MAKKAMPKKMQLTIKSKPPKIPAKRIQNLQRPKRPVSSNPLSIPRSKKEQNALLKPGKVRVNDRKPPTPAGTKFEDGSVQPGPDMPKRPKVKVRNNKPYGGK